MRRRDLACFGTHCMLVAIWTCCSSNEAFARDLDVRPLPPTYDRRPIKIADLVALREIGGMAGQGLTVSPNGAYVAFEMHQADIDLNAYHVGWFVAETGAAGLPKKIADGGDPILFRSGSETGRINGAWISQRAQWSADSQWIVYRKMGQVGAQLWRSSPLGVEQQLTHNTADVEAFAWSKDHSKLFFTTDAPRAVLAADIQHNEARGYLFDDDRTWWDALNSRPYRQRYALIGGKPALWVYDFATGSERSASDAEWSEWKALGGSDVPAWLRQRARVFARAANGKSIAWLEPESPAVAGQRAPLRLHVAEEPNASAGTICRAPQCVGMIDTDNVLQQGIWWDDRAQAVYFVRLEGLAYSKKVLYRWRVGAASAETVLTITDWISDCARVDRYAVCFHETASYPRTIVRFDLSTGRVTELADPNPEFAQLRVGEIERIEWTNAQGHPNWGYLVKPLDYVAGRRYPMVIVGYRARRALRGGVGDEYPVHVLAAHGFTVLVYEKPEHWKGLETARNSRELALFEWGEDLFDFQMPLSSFEAVIDLLARKRIADPERVGITGFSNGVGHACYALIHSNIFRAAAISGPCLSPSSYFVSGMTWEWRTQFLEPLGYGRPGADHDEKWKHHSLAHNLNRFHAPLLINAASNEYVAALQDIVTLREAKKPVEMHVHSGEYHVKWQPAHRTAIYQRNLDWFRFWLKGEEDPDASKAEQYRRWRELRQGEASVLSENATRTRPGSF